MKRFISVLFLLFVISAAVSAEELNGIFGIEFGASPEEVKTAMAEKGWESFLPEAAELKEDNSEEKKLYFIKKNGTYANTIVNAICIQFYEDQFYLVNIAFPTDTDLTELTNTVVSIKNKYNLSIATNKEEATYIQYIFASEEVFFIYIISQTTDNELLAVIQLLSDTIYRKKLENDEQKANR